MAATSMTLMESNSATTPTADAAAAADGAVASDIASTDNNASATVSRPTVLFDANETLLTTSAAGATLNTSRSSGPGVGSGGAGVGGGWSGSGSSPATSPSFLPEMPQWKKDLIQRRKTNVARTISAATLTSASAEVAALSGAGQQPAATADGVRTSMAIRSLHTTTKVNKITTSHQQQKKENSASSTMEQPQQSISRSSTSPMSSSMDAKISLVVKLPIGALGGTTVMSTSSRSSPTHNSSSSHHSNNSSNYFGSSSSSNVGDSKSSSIPSVDRVLGGHYTPPPAAITTAESHKHMQIEHDLQDLTAISGGALPMAKSAIASILPQILLVSPTVTPIPKQRSAQVTSPNKEYELQQQQRKQCEELKSERTFHMSAEKRDNTTTTAATTMTTRLTSPAGGDGSVDVNVDVGVSGNSGTADGYTAAGSNDDGGGSGGGVGGGGGHGDGEGESNTNDDDGTTTSVASTSKQACETTTHQATSGRDKCGSYAAIIQSTTVASAMAAMMATTNTMKAAGAASKSHRLAEAESLSQLETEPVLVQPLSQQFHFKYEGERSSSIERVVQQYTSNNTERLTANTKTINTLTAAPAACEKTVKLTTVKVGKNSSINTGGSGKIFSKLQNNHFIKNQQQIQLQQQQQQQQQQQSAILQPNISTRYLKYKAPHSLQESPACTNIPASATNSLQFLVSTPASGSAAAFETGSGARFASGSGATSSSPPHAVSPTKSFVTSSAPTACAIKKKMVAVQEMKKTTQNSNHHAHHGVHHQHHPHPHHPQIISGTGGGVGTTSNTCGLRQSRLDQRTRLPSQTSETEQTDKFDPGEELSYGPGIVSKLRCRYLSLAYRESLEKERHNNMRRATSLNNLVDREDHKDADDDIDGADEDDVDDQDYVELRVNNGKTTLEERKLKAVGGILKHGQDVNALLPGKKTTTFQKFATNGTAGESQTTLSNEGGSECPAADGADSPRSRHFKRGNDSLKRARSVEALLCERSSWHYTMNRVSAPPVAAPGGVTIEDKINNARRRLILGTDAMPPKRLTSVIDDTERPPPDLVKQTLKKFEATANRRGRGPSRTNGTGEVANKVANYKTIIKENKPAIVFPKPPLSPTKKLTTTTQSRNSVKTTMTTTSANNDYAGIPLTRKAGLTSLFAANNASVNANNITTVVPSTGSNNSCSSNTNITNVNANANSSGLSLDQSPDIMHRHKLLAERNESATADTPVTSMTKKFKKLQVETDKPISVGTSCGSTNTNITNANGSSSNNSGLSLEQSPDIMLRHKLLVERNDGVITDSPLTSLTKKLKKLQIDSDKQVSVGASCGSSSNVSIKETYSKQSLNKYLGENTTSDYIDEFAVKSDEYGHSDNNKFVGGVGGAVASAMTATGAGTGAVVGPAGDNDAEFVTSNDNNSQMKKKQQLNDRVVCGSGGIGGAETTVESDTAQAGIASAAISSDLSDDDNGPVGTDGNRSTERNKHITRTALDNIARAGTTQQFKFTGQTINTTTSTPPTKSTITQNNANNANKKHTLNADIPTSVLNSSSGKQIGVIRPLLTTTPHNNATLNTSNSNSNANININTTNTHNLQHMETLNQQSTYTSPLHYNTNSNNSLASHSNSKYHTHSHSSSPITPPSVTSSTTPTTLTSREIEKNRINEMKKTAHSEHVSSTATSSPTTGSVIAGTATSLNTVINTKSNNDAGTIKNSGTTSLVGTGASGYHETDTAGTNNSPLWALRKKRQTPQTAPENTTMVFNFSNRKEVPDYIENDGVIFRRKRELPKPNESGFVLLGDLSLETSTDSDCDDFSMCPPSPCDVEFENANIVIDGKSSIRQKPKEATHRVQFNDTLTSTFEYPSEASLIIEDSYSELYMHSNDSNDMINVYQNLRLDDNITDSPTPPQRHHHHVAVDEIIQLPTPANTSSPVSATNTPTKNILGNLPLGSAPLSFYTPVKAPIDNLFQLGVTRAPNGNSHAYTGSSSASQSPAAASASAIAAATNGNSSGTTNGNNNNKSNDSGNANGGLNFGGSIVGISDGSIDVDGEQPESLQYIKPANDDLTIAYSEGTQKTDLLY